MQVKFFTDLVAEMSNLIWNRWLFTLLLVMAYCDHNQIPTCYQCSEVDRIVYIVLKHPYKIYKS